MPIRKSTIDAKKYLRIACGVAFAIFALCALVGVLSYIFTWKRDQSAIGISAYFPESMQISNHGGGLGLGLGHFLTCQCFGLGAIIFVIVLSVVALKSLLSKKVDWLRASVAGIVGSFATGMLLAWVGSFFGGKAEMVFGGGLGGGACSFLVKAMTAGFGPVVTPVIILALIILILALFWEIAPAAPVKKPEPTISLEDVISFKDEDETPAAVQDDFGIGEIEEQIPDEDFAQEEEEPAPESEQQEAVPEVGVVVESPQEVITTDIEEELPQLDIKSDVDRYQAPSLDLLHDYADKRFSIPKEEVEHNSEKIKKTLESFKIPTAGISASVGYTVTLYKIILGEGVRVNQVKNVEEDIAIKIGIKGVRVVILSDAVGIEVPNGQASVVPLKAILNSDAFRACKEKGELPIAIGYTITTKAKVFDLADAPHLLVAGATKQGKSVGLNAIISSLLYSKHPTELKFVFIDPKMVEFSQYSRLFHHYLAVLPGGTDEDEEIQNSICKDPKSAEAVLRSLCIEMDERYILLSKAGVNKITDYNEKYSNRFLLPTEGHRFLPYLVVVIDEYADLTKSTFGSDRNLGRSIENSIIRLAAKGRAAGLHVIIATQRPSVDVITGLIKSNFPTRIAFKTASRQDSMTILGITGAERLIGKGDMLFFSGVEAERVQCALVGTDEIDALTKHISSQMGYKQHCQKPYYLPDPGDGEGGDDGVPGALVDMKNLDPLFEEAARLVVMNQQASTSTLQRKMQMGFARAGRVMDQLEAAGIVGPQKGSKSRDVLVPDFDTLQPILDAYLAH